MLPRLWNSLPPGAVPVDDPVVDLIFSFVAPVERGDRPGVRRFNLLYGGLVPMARSLDIDEVLAVFEAGMQLHVAEHARGLIFVHAGVVGVDGHAVVIPGSSRSGKSTLVEGLVGAGAAYYSDEYALFDSEGRVHPYPKPLALRRGRSRHEVSVVPERCGERPLRVGMIVATEYREGTTWKPRVRSSGKALLALLANTVAARSRPAEALTALRRGVSEALFLQGTRGAASDAAAAILDIAERRSQRGS